MSYVLTSALGESLNTTKGHAYNFAVKEKSTGGHCGTVYTAPALAEALVARSSYGDVMNRERRSTKAFYLGGVGSIATF